MSIQEIEKELKRENPTELFTSSAMATALTNLSNYIVWQVKSDASVSVNPEYNNSNTVGYTDGDNICVNFGSRFFKNVPSEYKKFILGKGILAHELGHVLYTNFKMTEKFIKGMLSDSQDKWQDVIKGYGGSYANKAKLQEFLNICKDKDSRILCARIYKDFENILEDGYIEEAMGRRFRGDLISSLYEVREYQYDGFTYFEDYEKKPSTPELFEDLLLCYAKYGIVKVKDDKSLSVPELRNFSTHLNTIDEIVSEDSSVARCNKAFAFFIDIFHDIYEEKVKQDAQTQKMLKEALEELSKMLKEASAGGKGIANGNSNQNTNSSESDNNKKNKESERDLNSQITKQKMHIQPSQSSAEGSGSDSAEPSESASQNGEVNSDSSRKSTSDKDGSEKENAISQSKKEGEDNNDKEGKSGQSSTEKESSKEEVSNKESDEGKNESNNSSDTSTDSKQSSNGQSRSGPESKVENGLSHSSDSSTENQTNVAESTRSLVEALKSIKNRTSVERTELSETTERLLSAVIKSAKEEKELAEAEEQASKQASQAAQQMASKGGVFKTHKDLMYHVVKYPIDNLTIKSYMDINTQRNLEHIGAKVAQEAKKVLTKRIKGIEQHGLHAGQRLNLQYYQKDKTSPFTKIKHPIKSSLCVEIIIDESGSMRGFKSQKAKEAAIVMRQFCSELNIPCLIFGHSSSYPSQTIYEYIDWDNKNPREKFRLANISGHNLTRDGGAILYGISKMKERREKDKIIFIISDGCPCDNDGYGGKAAEDDIKGLVKYAENLGAKIIAAAIDADKEVIKEIYGEDRFLDITELEALPKKFVQVIKKTLRI